MLNRHMDEIIRESQLSGRVLGIRASYTPRRDRGARAAKSHDRHQLTAEYEPPGLGWFPLLPPWTANFRPENRAKAQ